MDALLPILLGTATTEEDKLVAVERALPLLRGARLREEFLTTPGAAALVVSRLLELAEKERLRRLRVVALQCLRRLVECVAEQPRMLRGLLPGVSSALLRLARSDFKVGSDVPSEAIGTLRDFLLVTIADSTIFVSSRSEGKQEVIAMMMQNLRERSSSSSSSVNKVAENGASQDPAEMNWILEAVEKLTALFRLLFQVQDSIANGPQIRLEKARTCGDLLMKCSKTLSLKKEGANNSVINFSKGSAVSILLSSLISFLDDDYEPVRELASLQLSQFHEFVDSQYGIWEVEVCKMLQQEIHSQIRRLPSLSRQVDKKMLGDLFRSCRNHIRIIGDQFQIVVDSSPDSLIRSLIQTFEFDLIEIHTANAFLLAPLVTMSGSEQSLIHITAPMVAHFDYFRKQFVHIPDQHQNVLTDGLELIRVIGSFGNSLRLMDLVSAKIFHENEDYEEMGSDQPALTSEERPEPVIQVDLKPLISSVPSKKRNSVALTCLLLLSLIAQGGHRRKNNQAGTPSFNTSIPEHLLRFILSLPFWDAPLGGVQTQSAFKPSTAIRGRGHARALLSSVSNSFDGTLIAIALELLGDCSEMMGIHFRKFIPDVLFCVMEKMGDERRIVQQAAGATLRRIAIHCDYHRGNSISRSAGVTELLQNNIDYLVDGLAARLPHLNDYPNIPLVVEVVIKRIDLVPPESSQVGDINYLLFSNILLRDLLESVLHSLDLHWGVDFHVSRLLRVMQVVVDSLNSSARGSSSALPKKMDQYSVNDSADCVTQLLRELTFWQRVENDSPSLPNSSSEANDEADNNTEEDGVNPEESKSPLFVMTEKVMLRAQNFVSHPNLMIRRTAIDLVGACLIALAKHCPDQMNKPIPPLIHAIWPSVLSQLQRESSPSLICSCIQVVHNAIFAVGDFMAQRFVEDAWPCMRRWLLAHHKTAQTTKKTVISREGLLVKRSHVESQGPVISERDLTELAQQILRCLRFTSDYYPAVLERLVEDISKCTVPFLSIDFPDTIPLWDALVRIDGDAMWPILARLSGHTHIEPPPMPEGSINLCTLHLPEIAKVDSIDHIQQWFERASLLT